MKRIIRYIFFLIAFVCLFKITGVSAYAKEQTIKVKASIYEFDEKNDFMISNSKVSEGKVSDVGTLEITGNISNSNKKMGKNTAFVIDGNKAVISYSMKESLGEWYFTDVKDNTVNDIELDSKILKGSIIVQTSLDGKEWVIAQEYTDVFGKNTNELKEIYCARDVQLQNGCFYRIIVVYEQERVVEQKKVGFIKKEEKECRRIAEVYEFFAESKDKGQVTSPDIMPRMTYGKEKGVSTAVNTGEGYCLSKGTSILESKDPQFGWALGYFTINGYTESVKDDEGNDVFLKNVGDQVTLWFTLEKDINDLSGDGRLSISEDDDAEDLDFQIRKSNFKRGTLIISHLDSENVSKEPIIYTDYLAANASIGANTRVTLFEEGDYEVALDYEIKNEPHKIGSVAIAPKYTNYKVYFKFSIRNGNCMAYPFDIKSGSELRDGDDCEEGFTIKLAGSRYNEVAIKYDVVVGEEGQKKFDTRKNMIAKDGATYTDEGVYTFSVNNPYTNVTTTKTVYVGTDPYLKALSKTGRSLSEINDKIQQGYLIEDDGSINLPKMETPEPEMIQEIIPEQIEDIPVIAEVDSDAVVDVVEEVSEENGDNETIIKESPKQENKTSSLIVPISVGLVAIIGIIYMILKNKKKIVDIPKDPEEDLR